MTEVRSDALHELAMALAELKGEVKAMRETLDKAAVVSEKRESDHENRIRLLESRPVGITWPSFLTTSVSLILAAGGVLALLDRI